MGTPGKIDQPWQHRLKSGILTPVGPGPFKDNPPVLAPAGTGHMAVGDWARFLALHAGGAGANGTVVKPETLKRLHTPPFGGSYAGGWEAQQGGRILTHAGSNKQNFAIAWIAPDRRLAIGVMTNAGGRPGHMACDNMVGPLMTRFGRGTPAGSAAPVRRDPGSPKATPDARPVFDPVAAARAKRVTVRFSKTPVREVCAVLTRDSGITVSSQRTYLDTPVTLDVKDAPLDEILEAIAKQVGASVQVRDGGLRFRSPRRAFP